MTTEKTPSPDVYAKLRRTLVPAIPTIIDEVNRVRVKPPSAAGLTPPWRRWHSTRPAR